MIFGNWFQKEEERKIQEKLKKEEKEKRAIDEQMELANKFQEENKEKYLEKKNIEAAPVDLEKDRPQISFSFGSIFPSLVTLSFLDTTKTQLNNPLKKIIDTSSMPFLDIIVIFH